MSPTGGSRSPFFARNKRSPTPRKSLGTVEAPRIPHKCTLPVDFSSAGIVLVDDCGRVAIVEIGSEQIALKYGIQEGDVVHEVDSKRCHTLDEVRLSISAFLCASKTGRDECVTAVVLRKPQASSRPSSVASQLENI